MLLTCYSHTEVFLQEIDDKLLALLQKNVGNIKQKIEHHKAQLKRKGYFLLVAGK